MAVQTTVEASRFIRVYIDSGKSRQQEAG